MQYVKVDLDGKAYTYGWTGSEPLKRGDRVEVPSNVVNPKPSVRTVLRAMPGPDYDVDKIVNILSKVEEPPRPCACEGHEHEDGKHGCSVEIVPGRAWCPCTETRPGTSPVDPGVDLGRPEPHDWDDLIGDLDEPRNTEGF